MGKKLLIILLLLVLALLAIAVIGKKTFMADRNKTKVSVSEVKKRDIVETVNIDGKIYPETEVKLSVEVPGEVTAIYVKEGDSVQAGDLLITIDASTFESTVAQTNAGYNQALANLESAKVRVQQAQRKTCYSTNKPQ